MSDQYVGAPYGSAVLPPLASPCILFLVQMNPCFMSRYTPIEVLQDTSDSVAMQKTIIFMSQFTRGTTPLSNINYINLKHIEPIDPGSKVVCLGPVPGVGEMES